MLPTGGNHAAFAFGLGMGAQAIYRRALVAGHITACYARNAAEQGNGLEQGVGICQSCGLTSSSVAAALAFDAAMALNGADLIALIWLISHSAQTRLTAISLPLSSRTSISRVDARQASAKA